MSRDTRAHVIAFSVLGLLLVVHTLLFFPMRVDDAFILLRYAENLAAGNGPVFNPGERVEGFTSPAMVVLEAALLRLGVEPLLAVKLFGILCGLVLLGVTMALARELSGSRAAGVLAGLLVALHTGVAVACINGLETAPFAALVALGLYFHVRARSPRDEGLAGLALALALLFRPEGGLPLAFIGVSALWRWREEPDRWRRWLALALPTLVLVVPVQALKAEWFGSLTPNTLLAKVPLDATGRLASGLDYLAGYGTAHYGYLALLSLWALALKADPRFRLLALLATVWTGYIASVGGDWIPHYRFLVPLVPLAAVGTATTLVFIWKLLGERPREGVRTPARAGLVLLAAAAVLPAALLELRSVLEEVHWGTRASVRAREPLGPWLMSLAGPGTSVAMLDVGAVAYRSGLRVIDTGGLTDARVARVLHTSHGGYQGYLFFPDKAGAREIARVVLADEPSFVVLRLNGELPWLLQGRVWLEGRPLTLRAAYEQDRALIEAPGFTEQYEYLCSIPSDLSPFGWVWHYNVFARKGLPLAHRPQPDAEGATRCF
ncbi:glycosyltransferase family 39 protein [Archangium sp.]|uniref:glycosyltransferase family 39 protein n=1 Tax=Archangium sp. TaxID=1872627 RepID=UPI00389A0679